LKNQYKELFFGIFCQQMQLTRPMVHQRNDLKNITRVGKLYVNMEIMEIIRLISKRTLWL
jgi:hypothetical protein